MRRQEEFQRGMCRRPSEALCRNEALSRCYTQKQAD
ncbi:hypothetical protein EHQ30_11070 [Leptospira brenneri]|uniref:Uncharacterized protein n=1 Tax=Leptospira brenneri TaxID=2023182 RepID=A0A5F1Z746_9LEPT|nr:hypothetical protein EHQ30_11070 [Leptospira brenneri]